MERRKILRTIGSVSIGIGSMDSISAHTTLDDTGVNVETVDERDPQHVVADARSDAAFQNIVRRVESSGWQLPGGQINARRVAYEQSAGYYDFIVAEAERSSPGHRVGDDEEMIVMWVGNDTIGLDLPQHTVAHHVRKTPGPSIGNNQRPNNFFGWDEITVIRYDDGMISESERDFHGEEESGMTENFSPFTTPPITDPGGGGDCCTVDIEIGSDAKWGCTALAILSAGISGWTCGACFLDPTRATCALCVIGAAASGISTAHCFSNTVTVQEGVEQSWLLDNDFSCGDFEPTTDNAMLVSESFYSEELSTC